MDTDIRARRAAGVALMLGSALSNQTGAAVGALAHQLLFQCLIHALRARGTRRQQCTQDRNQKDEPRDQTAYRTIITLGIFGAACDKARRLRALGGWPNREPAEKPRGPRFWG